MRRLQAGALTLHLLAGILLSASPASRSRCAVGIDHVPVAVHDLDRAAEICTRLGFVIKPGRFHANGIRNEHVKFEDGAGIEFITAKQAVDAQSGAYVQLLSKSEGPAFLSFHTPDLQLLHAGFRRAGFPYSEEDGVLTLKDPGLPFVFFFEGDNRSPTDRPEHFRHPNSAYATAGVWIADGEDSRLVPLLKSIGGAVVKKNVFVPAQRTTTVVEVQNGDVVLLPRSSQTIPGRPIAGLVFLTRDLSAARHCLDSSHIAVAGHVEAAGYESIFVGPQQAFGMWIEFRQLRSSSNAGVPKFRP